MDYPRWCPNHEITWHTEWLLLHVRHTNSKCYPSLNTNIEKLCLEMSFSQKTVFLDFLKCSQYKVNEETDISI